MSNTQERIINIISEHLSYDKNKIKLESDISNDLGADSLDSVEIVIALEEEFGISILDSEAENIRTVEQLVKLIEEKLKK
jgi:acyl carrier protein